MKLSGPCLVALLAACAPKAPPPAPQVVVLPSAPVTDTHSTVAAVLKAAGYVALLPVDLQRDEIEAARLAFERDRLPSDRLRLALLLTLAAPPLQDPDRVDALLAKAPFAPDQGAYEALARLVLLLRDERAGRAEDRAAAAARLAEETARRRDLEARVQALEEVERRLEALKALETGAVTQ